MTAAQLFVGLALIAAYLLLNWLILRGGTGVPVSSRGRRRAGAGRVSALACPAGPVPVDDWTADLPTSELPMITDADLAEVYEDVSLAATRFATETRTHTSPTESLRGRYELESPVFMELAKPLGFDPVRGFAALFSVDGLVAA